MKLLENFAGQEVSATESVMGGMSWCIPMFAFPSFPSCPKTVTPITPITPVTPVTPETPVTPVTPVTPETTVTPEASYAPFSFNRGNHVFQRSRNSGKPFSFRF